MYYALYEDERLVGVFGLGSAFARPKAIMNFMEQHQIEFNELGNNTVFCLHGHRDRNAGTKFLAMLRRDAKAWWYGRCGIPLITRLFVIILALFLASGCTRYVWPDDLYAVSGYTYDKYGNKIPGVVVTARVPEKGELVATSDARGLFSVTARGESEIVAVCPDGSPAIPGRYKVSNTTANLNFSCL